MAGAQYTCCNLRYDDDWISDANWAKLPFIPAGARIKLVKVDRNRASVLIEGRPLRIGLDYGRKQMTTEQLLAKLAVNRNPQDDGSSYPEAVQAAIRAGKVMPGMTKAQVIASLGFPRADTTATLDHATWIYWTYDEEQYFLAWNAEGVLKEITGPADVLAAVTFKP